MSRSDEDLFEDDELAWEDEDTSSSERVPVERWSLDQPSRRPPPPPEPVGLRELFARRPELARVSALLAAAVLAVVAVVLVVALRGGKSVPTDQPVPPAAPAVTTPPTTAAKAPTTTATAPSTVPSLDLTQTLKAGDSGAEVKQLQLALSALGLESGAADGVFGPKTKAAVIAFQRGKGLTADGVVGPKTLQALQQALSQLG